MKKIVFFLFGIYLMVTITLAQSTVTDFDGNVYQTVEIGNQVWMAENLNSTHYSNGTAIPLVEDSTAWVNLSYTDKAYCYYDNNISNGDVYGALYTWPAAMNGEASSDNNPSGVQGVCPNGWHLPGDTEWKELEMYLGMSQAEANVTGWRGTDEGGKLKEAGTTHWNSPNTGANNISGFTALPGGFRGTVFGNLDKNAYFWPSTESSSGGSWYRGLSSAYSEIARSDNYDKRQGFSVRCVRDETDTLEISLIGTGVTSINGTDGSVDLTVIGGVTPYTYSWSNGATTEDISGLTAGVYSIIVTDAIDSTATDTVRIYDTFIDERDAQVYKTITIGDQIWMAENLNSTHYTDGTPLVNGTGAGDITGDYTTKYYFWYDDDSVTYSETYGALYTWAAVMNGAASSNNSPSGVQGVCPDGWDLPSDTAWKQLEMHLGMSQASADSTDWRGTDEGGKLKETGITHWNSPNTGATNSTGFTATPGDFREYSGSYTNVGNSANFWSSTEEDSYGARYRALVYDRAEICHISYGKEAGFSVRCVKTHSLYTDSLALVALYNSTDGVNWTNNTNYWLTGNVSDWYGITVSGNRVTEISLIDNNLTGTIPAEIGNLTNLTGLTLFDNNISGSIPTEIGNLVNLTNLNIHCNNLSGSIPAEIGNLTNLTELDLFINQLTGSIPSEIGNLTNLTLLYLFSNQLSGSIPVEIGNLTNLADLRLSSNQLTGSIPAEIGNLMNLNQLDLGNNQLSGTIPTQIGSLLNLTDLRLNINQISGSIPTEIGNLTNLTYLNLHENNLTGTIPAEIGNLSSLELLELYTNQLSGAVPNEIGNLTNLQSLHITNNQFTELPDLSSLTNIINLSITNNQFTFEDIEPNIGITGFVYSPQDSVGEIIDTTFILDSGFCLESNVGGENNQYQWYKDGNILSGYQATNDLYCIGTASFNDTGIYTCEITNTIATELTLYSRPINVFVDYSPSQKDSLALVALYDSTDGANWINNTNWLTGPVSTWYGITVSGDRVTQIDLNSNNLVGTIPAEIGNLTNLQDLNFYANQLTGSIPSEIGSLTNLGTLDLRSNQLTGSIPTEIGNLNLDNLFLESNQFSGSIPVEIGSMTNLSNVILGNNQLTGAVPASFTGLTNLVYLWLNDNLLVDLPDLSSLDSLDALGMENNRFTFEDIEPNIGVASTIYTYSPQDSVGQIIDTTVYVGTSYTMSVSTGGANSKYQWKKNGVSIGSISSDSTYTFNSVAFSDSGTYTCEITNTVATDLTLYSRPIHVKATIISSFPYSEDFESGSGDWHTGGANSSWQYGTPAAPTINSSASGTRAWVTNLAGDYNLNEISYVTSPRFDLSGLNYPKIEFIIWWDAEGFYDGANFQYKQGADAWKTLGTDEGDDSWYNSSYLYSIEKGFGFDLNNSAGWTGDNEWGYGSNGWVTVDHALTSIEDRSDVSFRIAFASNSSYQNDGVAIDDINIYDDPTGIDAVNGLLSDIQIYPNPNEGKFRLVYNGERDIDLKLQLINLHGQVVLSEQIETGYRYSKEFELDYLPSGIYYFRLMNKEGVVVKKMVVK